MESPLGNANQPRRSVCTPTYGDPEYSFLDGSDIDITPDEEEEEYFPERLKIFGVGGAAVMFLCTSLHEGTRVYFDRFFTTVTILDELRKKKLPATGTIMKNRIPAEANCFSTDKEMMVKGRGTSEQLVRPGDDIALTKWFDNNPIILASTEIGINPESVCRRWDSKNKKYVDVQRPAVVSNYNMYMGGIDLADRYIGYYRSGSKTNKWTVRTIFHFLNLSVSNSWIQYREDQLALGTPKKDIMDMLYFKMTLAGNLLYADTEHNENSENSEEEIEPNKIFSNAIQRQKVVKI